MLQLREYQQRSLDALVEYFKSACVYGAKQAFILATNHPYHAVPQLENMPYICQRVPTGGGKTLMATYAVGIAAREYLQSDRAVCLWLAPSNTIVDQTLAALRDRQHPYRQALDAHFAGQVRVLDLQEALSLQRGTLDGETVVIVSTLAALRVEDTNGRKVYETNGALQHHFTGLTPELEAKLERDAHGILAYSLANVLRLHCPIVIMDEAHNARTRLSFDTLTRFNPSCVIEYTATPVTINKPENGFYASNVLTHVSARELKEAKMIKLPVKLRTREDWKEVIGDAVGKQRELEAAAKEEERATGEYIRPLVLFQAQPSSKERQNLTVDVIRQTLIDDLHIPAEQTAIATGDTREIDGVNLFDATCPIRFIITQQALKEGWDCSFAYIFCSLAEQQSSRAVEQLLGRVLRMPHASRKQYEELNCAYAYVCASSLKFLETAQSLQDALVESGFQKLEVSDLVTSQDEQPSFPDFGGLFAHAAEFVYEPPDFSNLGSIIRDKVAYDPRTNTLSVQSAITETEKTALQHCFTREEDKAAVERLFHRSRGVTPLTTVPTAVREPFSVPMLGIRVNGVLELFDDSHFLDLPWHLAECDASLTEVEFPSRITAGAAAEIDVSQSGALAVTKFVYDLQEQLSLITAEPGWTMSKLAIWLDQQIPHLDISQAQSSLYIYKAVNQLVESRGIPVERLARFKYRLRNAIEAKIDQHRRAFRQHAYTQSLFGPEPAALEVTPECQRIFTDDGYAPNTYYTGGRKFDKHYFHVIGDMNNEEAECAAILNSLPQVKYWVRNLERRPHSSFWLPTATDNFYPDFVVMLQDGRYLVVEYKGGHLSTNDDSKEKRAVGELWAERSNGQCLFVMPSGKDWGAIQQKL